MTSDPTYRIVCADGDDQFPCGPHRVEEVPDDE
jgi:hypothetical protein